MPVFRLMKNIANRFIPLLIGLLLLASVNSLSAETVTYKIDPSHSGITFKIRHFLTKVSGTFGEFSGQIKVDTENPENNYAEATIKVTSVDTNNKKRDSHLLNEDFFTAHKFPEINFKSINWKKTGQNQYDMTGLLTLMGVSRKLIVAVNFLGTATGFGGVELAAWEGTANLNRTDFGLTYGPGVVGEEVEIEINIEAYKE